MFMNVHEFSLIFINCPNCFVPSNSIFSPGVPIPTFTNWRRKKEGSCRLQQPGIVCLNWQTQTSFASISVKGRVKQTKGNQQNWQGHTNRHKEHQSFEDSMARSPAPGFGWNHSQNSSFEESMARSLAPGFGWNTRQNSSFEDSMAWSPAPGSGWSQRQNSSFEESMARPPAPGFGWNDSQNSSFEDSMARWPAPGFGWTSCQKSCLQGCRGDAVNILHALLL